MSYNWVHSSAHSGLHPNAVYAGNDVDGSAIYVGRAYHEGDQIPAKVIPSRNVAYVPHNGQEIVKHQYELLCGTGFTWVASAHGHVPEGAVSAGSQGNGEPLYIGRAHFQGSLTPGKVHRSHNCLYIPFNGGEHSITEYEVLVAQQRANWVSVSAYEQLPGGAILAGNDVDGAPIYVGRCHHGGDLVPAKVLHTKQAAYIPFSGQEIPVNQYEILCNGNVSWVPSSHGSIPPGALVAGRTSVGEQLYVGRAHYQGSLTPGKVHPSHGCLYIPFGGQEVTIRDYEILIEH